MSPKTDESAVEVESASSTTTVAGAENVPEEPTETREQKTIRAKKLFEDGKRAYMTNSFADASKHLADACELHVSLYNELAPECADLFLFYGKTLLELSRLEGGVFSNALTGVDTEEESADDEGDDEGEENAEEKKEDNKETEEEAQFEDTEKLTPEEKEEIHEQVEEALEENAEALAAGKVLTEEELRKEEEEAAKAEEVDVPEEPTSSEDAPEEAEEPTEESAEPKADETEEVSNLQLAYENLDVCRTICEKQEGEGWRKKLAECRLTLGEVAIDDERYSDAENDLTECLAIQKAVYSANDRRIAETFFQIGRARNLSNKFTEAGESYKAALDVVKAKLDETKEKVEKAEGDEKKELEKDIEELSSLIPDLEAKIVDCEGSAKATSEMKEDTNGVANGTNGNGFKPNEESASKPVDNITHLIRKPLKRSADSQDLKDTVKKVREEVGDEDCAKEEGKA